MNIPYTNIAKYKLGATSDVGTRHPSETAIFSAVHVAKSCFVWCFVDNCLSFFPFSFDRCIVYPSSICVITPSGIHMFCIFSFMIKTHVLYILGMTQYRYVVPTTRKWTIDVLVSITYVLVSITYVLMSIAYVLVSITYVLMSMTCVGENDKCVGEYNMRWWV